MALHGKQARIGGRILNTNAFKKHLLIGNHLTATSIVAVYNE